MDMVFSTVIFLCMFLPVTILGYYICPKQFKNLFLLLCSLFFYAWGEPVYVLIMIGSILFNFIFGLLLDKKASKLWLTLAVVTNLGVLGVFKYAGFVVDNVHKVFPQFLQIPQIALPIGISFYTFQGLSYCIDVYRKDAKAQKNPVDLALYISMFPQLIAGPIVRYTDVQKELKNRVHSPEQFAAGAERFLIGLSKKAILANSMGAMATRIMNEDLTTMSTSVAWLGAIAYTLQIYFDFSGYSDMAIGLGHIFGFHFPENFNYPYISKSIREFWRRWHISLSTWFKDYLYIPLGGNKRGNVYFNLFVVFVATGIWHGAAWGFLLWGLWHGFFSIVERVVAKRCGALKELDSASILWMGIKSVLAHAYTLAVVIFGWVLFSLVSVRQTVAYYKVMLHLSGNHFVAYKPSYYLGHKNLCLLIIALLACLPWKAMVIFLFEKFGKKDALVAFAGSIPAMLLKRAVLLVLLWISFVCIITSTYNPFIYFRF